MHETAALLRHLSEVAHEVLSEDPVLILTGARQAGKTTLVRALATELEKQLGWSKTKASLFHFRDRGGAEVDAILETMDGRVAAVEVKAGTRVDAADLRGLELLRDRLGDRFVHGVVLFTGTIAQDRGDRLRVLPMRELWRGPPHAP